MVETASNFTNLLIDMSQMTNKQRIEAAAALTGVMNVEKLAKGSFSSKVWAAADEEVKKQFTQVIAASSVRYAVGKMQSGFKAYLDGFSRLGIAASAQDKKRLSFQAFQVSKGGKSVVRVLLASRLLCSGEFAANASAAETFGGVKPAEYVMNIEFKKNEQGQLAVSDLYTTEGEVASRISTVLSSNISALRTSVIPQTTNELRQQTGKKEVNANALIKAVIAKMMRVI